MPVSDGQSLRLTQSLESNRSLRREVYNVVSGALIGEHQSLDFAGGNDAGSLVALSDGLAFEELTKSVRDNENTAGSTETCFNNSRSTRRLTIDAVTDNPVSSGVEGRSDAQFCEVDRGDNTKIEGGVVTIITVTLVDLVSRVEVTGTEDTSRDGVDFGCFQDDSITNSVTTNQVNNSVDNSGVALLVNFGVTSRVRADFTISNNVEGLPGSVT